MQATHQTKVQIRTQIRILIQTKILAATTTKKEKETSRRGFLFWLTSGIEPRNIKGYYTGGILWKEWN